MYDYFLLFEIFFLVICYHQLIIHNGLILCHFYYAWGKDKCIFNIYIIVYTSLQNKIIFSKKSVNIFNISVFCGLFKNTISGSYWQFTNKCKIVSSPPGFLNKKCKHTFQNDLLTFKTWVFDSKLTFNSHTK